MKAIWTGSISFGLVNIPVRMYSASEPQKAGFRLIHKKDNVPIKYKRWCPKHKKEVSWDDIAKGLAIAKNKYYIFEKEELQSLRPEKTDTIDILEVIDSNQVDPIYFSSNYFIGPASEKEKAYFLLKEALQQSAKAAIGKFVMREKEYICLIDPYKQGLLLTTLSYAPEVRDIAKVDFLDKKQPFTKQEIELAIQLITKLEKKEFDITEFRDTFLEELKELIRRKAAGEVIIAKETPKHKKEKNLIEALKASL